MHFKTREELETEQINRLLERAEDEFQLNDNFDDDTIIYDRMDEAFENEEFDNDSPIISNENSIRGRRSKYHARIDKFLTNGIIIVGVLLLAVLLIAFLV
ncbi:hypothetical protein KBI51_07100 [Aerococcaceae bacterium zg-ZUI334]|uniref:hypothetical protein n=1 Tax=Aerococcaceae bacterium zg-252 TaxID=2796928 RepID=UPI001B9A2BBE|nr:hypothetical protein [Aerococcaceae bacterium zg-ZUI334]